jgi:RimJ/RimL family protein N-acetyltransferase
VTPSLETERLLLRPLVSADAVAYGWLDERLSPERARADAEQAEAHWREHGFGPWAVLEREGGSLVAVLDIHHAGAGIEGIAPDEIEIGWVVDPRSRGRGIATEAGGAVVADAFGRLGLERLVAYVRLWNAESLRVVAKLGLHEAGEGRTRSGDPMRIFRLERADYDRPT